jgi:hypothetical protein
MPPRFSNQENAMIHYYSQDETDLVAVATVTDERSIIEEIKRMLRTTNESTCYYAIRDVYARYGNPLVNQAFRELENEE